MAKGQPFRIRLSESTEKVVAEEARRTGRSRSAVVEAFTEETARTRRFPRIGFRGDGSRRRAWVPGTGLDVWEIVDMVGDFGSIDALVADTQLDASQVRIALAYRDAYSDEIDEAVADNHPSLDDLSALYPFIETSTGRRADAVSAADRGHA